MTLPAYDIFKKHDAALVWVESAQDLATAKKRVEELSKQSPCEYFVFDQRHQRVVARLNPSACLRSTHCSPGNYPEPNEGICPIASVRHRIRYVRVARAVRSASLRGRSYRRDSPRFVQEHCRVRERC